MFSWAHKTWRRIFPRTRDSWGTLWSFTPAGCNVHFVSRAWLNGTRFILRSNVVKTRAILGHVSARWPRLVRLVWDEYERPSKFAIQPIHPCHNDASMESAREFEAHLQLRGAVTRAQLHPEVQATQVLEPWDTGNRTRGTPVEPMVTVVVKNIPLHYSLDMFMD